MRDGRTLNSLAFCESTNSAEPTSALAHGRFKTTGKIRAENVQHSAIPNKKRVGILGIALTDRAGENDREVRSRSCAFEQLARSQLASIGPLFAPKVVAFKAVTDQKRSQP